MLRTQLTFAGSVLATPALASSAAARAQEDCSNRGAPDAMYCGAGGDPVADPPQDESEIVDPSTLVFAYAAVEDPAMYEDIGDPFIQHLSEETGLDVQFFAVQFV